MSIQVLFSCNVLAVLVGSESCQSFLIHVYSQRVEGGNPNVYPHIEFESINEQRVTNVVANHNTVFLLFEHLLYFVSEPYPPTLGLVMRLDDVPLVFLILCYFLAVLQEGGGLCW